MFHVEFRHFPHVARSFNLSVSELSARIVEPWVRGETVELGDHTWLPGKAELTIYEGRELRSDELAMGRGWQNAVRHGEDVTERVLAHVAPAAGAPAAAMPALEHFKEEVLAQCGSGRIGAHQVMWLAGERFPGSRASERLALAEQAVWELLHHGRLRLLDADGIVESSRWEAIVLAWGTWAGSETVLLERTDRP